MFNVFGRSRILYKAIAEENIELLEKRLKSGADPNVKDKNEETPIFKVVASESKRTIEMLRLLIRYGADLNIRDSRGFSVIHETNSLEIAEILVENGADLTRIVFRQKNLRLQLHVTVPVIYP